MTIEQAQDAAELLKHRNKIKAIQSRMKADKTLVVCMSNGTTSFPEEAMPYIEEALAAFTLAKLSVFSETLMVVRLSMFPAKLIWVLHLVACITVMN